MAWYSLHGSVRFRLPVHVFFVLDLTGLGRRSGIS